MNNRNADTSPPATGFAVHEQLRLSVYHVERTHYRRLRGEMEHPHWALSHVAAGDVRTITRGESFHAPRGSVMIHPPNLPYAEYAEVEGVHEWIIFEARMPPDLDYMQLHPLPPVVSLRAPEKLSASFSDLLVAWRRPSDDPGRDLRVFSLVSGLLVDLVEDWRQAGAVPRPAALRTAQSRFTGLIRYMSQHLHRRITRAELARTAHLQPNYLDRVFRSAYGVAPMQMLLQLRLQRVRHLLESTEETVEAVAAACGFEEASRLTRIFHREFGEPPGHYRKGVKSARNRYAQL